MDTKYACGYESFYTPKARFNALPTGYKTEYSQDYLMSLGMRPTGDFVDIEVLLALLNLVNMIEMSCGGELKTSMQ